MAAFLASTIAGSAIAQTIVCPADGPAKLKLAEYYIQAETTGGTRLWWPATAPDMNQTVVTIEERI